jgi:hypothetical protein
MLGHSPIAFLKVQKWIINFYADGTTSKIGNIFQMILLNKWYRWWGHSYGKIDEWRYTWPLLCIGFMVALIFKIKNFAKNHKMGQEPILLLLIWSVVYLLFLIFIPVWPRYLLLLLPFLYTICMWLFVELTPLSKVHSQKKKK